MPAETNNCYDCGNESDELKFCRECRRWLCPDCYAKDGIDHDSEYNLTFNNHCDTVS